MVIKTLWTLIPIALMGAYPAHAQQEPDANYLLRPGDTICITVWGLPEYSLPQVQIRPDGRVAHPFAGELAAAGKTPKQLADHVAKVLGEKELKDPRVSVSVVEFRLDYAFVTGAVLKPGQVTFHDKLTVQQAIAQAGGLAPDADTSGITLTTPDKRTVPIDLQANAQTPVVTGSTLSVAARKLMAVLGAVKSPGMLGIPPRGRLSDAIALAGGLTADAEPEAAHLTRAQQAPIAVDLAAVLADVNSPANLPLKEGDAILVPSRQPRTVAVLGAVVAPGVKTFEKGSRVSNAVAQAGGPLKSADLDAASLMRGDGTILPLKLRELLAGAGPEADLALQPSDVILVPELKLPTVVVMGAVRTPGSYVMQPGGRVSEALAMAGGLDPAADTSSASLIHVGGKSEIVDLQAILERHDQTANLAVADRDLIWVRSLAQAYVWVSGPVNRPGRVTLAEVKRLSDLVTIADRKPEASDEAILQRAGGELIKVDLRAVLADKGGKADLLLRDGDTLTITSAALSVSVVGAVGQPGKRILRVGDRFTDAIAAAGDLTPEADRRSAAIVRAGGATIEVNPDLAFARKTEAANPLLEDGDTVIARGAQNLVFVQGEVARPGVCKLKVGERFSTAVALVGGLLPGTRAKTAVVQRGDKSLQVDLEAVFARADVNADIPLEDGDSVIIQAPPVEEIYVLGRVATSQKLVLGKGERVSDAIARAGGLAADADQRRATIMHADGSVENVDLEGVLKRRDPEANLRLRAGDTLLIGTAVQGYAAILGDVKAPGLYPIEEGQRVSDLLARASGTLATADLKACTLRRSNGTIANVDLAAVLNHTDPKADLALENGDTLTVGSTMIGEVIVIGAVKQQGPQPLLAHARASEALARAQGALDTADLANATITRGGRTQRVDLARAILEHDSEADTELLPGDVLYVPSADYRVVVIGAVATQGRVPIKLNARVTDALAAAGGLADNANRTACTLLRGNGEKMTVDLRRILQDKDSTANVQLGDGDTLMVDYMPKVKVTVWGKVLNNRQVEMSQGARLSEALAQAGGLLPEADAEKVQIVRGAEILTVDVRGWQKGEGLQNDVGLQDGDLVNVPESPHTITILGYVKNPGVLHFVPGDTLLEVTAKAGGYIPGESAPGRAVLVRQVDGKRQWTEVNLLALSSNPRLKDNAIVRDGDHLFIPAKSTRNLREIIEGMFPAAMLVRVLQ